MKKIYLLALLIFTVFLAGCAKTTTPTVTEIENTGSEACKQLKATLDTQPQTIALFGETLTLPNLDCATVVSDSVEEVYIMADAQIYKGANISARYSLTDVFSDISIGNVSDFNGLGETEASYMPVLDITHNITLSEKQKGHIGGYKIIASVGPSGDTPRNDGKFVISIIGKTGNVIYYIESQPLEIPEFSYLIKQASDDSIDQFDGNMPKDQKMFNELSAKYKEDNINQSKDYAKQITFSSMQYISQLIQENLKYKTFLIDKAQRLIDTFSF